MSTNKVLSDDHKRMFIRDGYILLRNAIPKPLVQQALNTVTAAYQAGDYTIDESKFDPVPTFKPELQKHPDLATLLEESPIFSATEDLLGEGNVVYGRKPQIAVRRKDKRMVQKGMGMTDLVSDARFHIDGGDGPLGTTGTPFCMLVGVCLSWGQHIDENRGQFTAWPGSHFKLHSVVRQRWKAGLIKGHGIFGSTPSEKPKIGKPIRVLMKPGDVVIAHQRLGHAGGINLHDIVRKNLYFRMNHKQHNEKVYDMLNGSVFTEYEGLHNLHRDIAHAQALADGAQ